MSALKPNLSEETLELLDEVYDGGLAHEFIENHGENYFLTYYEKYEELVKEYGQNLIDEFAEHYDVDTVEHFDEMYQGQFTSGGSFAETIATDCGYVTRELPHWIEIDLQKTWDNALSYDYTELIGGHIFNNNY